MTFGAVGGVLDAAKSFVECFGMWQSNAVGSYLFLDDGLELSSLTYHPVRSCFPLS